MPVQLVSRGTWNGSLGGVNSAGRTPAELRG